MRAAASPRSLILVAASVSFATAGCTQNAYTLHAQNQSLLQQQTVLAQRNQELQSRAEALDRDNQDVKALLAQERQQAMIHADEVVALKQQLKSTAAQLTQAERDRLETQKKFQAASARRAPGAEITANNSLHDAMPVIEIAGVNARQDGDVVRIELPADELFQQGSPHLRPGAEALIDQVAAEVLRTYPDQKIGVEGHTDSDPVTGQWVNNHQLAVSQAMTVENQLVYRNRFSSRQVFVVGHGANHPVVSNATPAGKKRNRRVELVVYPDKFDR